MFIRYNRPVRRNKSGPTKKNISLSETSDLSDNLDENLVQIKEILADFSDLVIKKFKIAGKQQVAAIIYIDGLIDTTTLYNWQASRWDCGLPVQNPKFIRRYPGTDSVLR